MPGLAINFIMSHPMRRIPRQQTGTGDSLPTSTLICRLAPANSLGQMTGLSVFKRCPPSVTSRLFFSLHIRQHSTSYFEGIGTPTGLLLFFCEE